MALVFCSKNLYTCSKNSIRLDMIDRSNISVIYKFVVDGENAQKVYDVLRESYVGKNKKLPPSQGEQVYEIEYSYEDGVLHIEERASVGGGGYIEEFLCFLIPYDSFERCDDSYDAGDEECKCVVCPPKTECELQQKTEQVES